VADLPLDLQPEIDVRANQSGVDIIFARRQAEVMIRKLNEEQRQAFHSIMSAVNNVQHNPKQFFLDGPGGTGKTFLYNAITYAILGEGSGVTPVASTGIASALLINGKTFHSQFFPRFIDRLSTPLLLASNSPL
jgi:DNA replication protein DnaC